MLNFIVDSNANRILEVEKKVVMEDDLLFEINLSLVLKETGFC